MSNRTEAERWLNISQRVELPEQDKAQVMALMAIAHALLALFDEYEAQHHG